MFGGSGTTGGFSFGGANTSTAPQQSAAAKPAFSFGGAQTTTPKPLGASSSFSFGSGANTNGATKPPAFNLGASATAAPAAPAASGGLFGQANNSSAAPTASTGLFNKPATSQSTSLFGQSNGTTATAAPSGGLFGQSNASTAPKSGLFGQANTNPTATGATSSLFGQNNTNTQSTGLFGQSNTNTQSTGLFGQQQPQQQQQQQPQQNSLFSQPAQSSQPSFAWSKPQQPAQLQQPTFQSSQPIQQTQSVQQLSYTPNINDQLINLQNSWDPNSDQCKMKTYFYNKIPTANGAILNYDRPADESPKDWETAMMNRPVKYNSIPVKVKGFEDLEKRSNFQVEHIKQSRLLLNEINGNLVKLIEKHDLDTSSRLLNCQLKYKNLSKKLLNIAIILSILKSKGYSLSNDEIKLVNQFNQLNQRIDNPVGLARSDELWVRLTNLKEKSTNLTDLNGLLNSLNEQSGTTDAMDESSDEPNAYLVKIANVLKKQQQCIQYLYDLIETDQKLIDGMMTQSKQL